MSTQLSYADTMPTQLKNQTAPGIGTLNFIPCKIAPSLQLEKLAIYEREKDIFLEQAKTGSLTKEPRHLLQIAEDNYKLFTETTCEDYLTESVLLY